MILDTRFEAGLLTATDIAAFDKFSSLLPSTMQIKDGSTLEAKFREFTADKSARIAEAFGDKSPFVTLSDARSDISGMGPATLLVRDYKKFDLNINGKTYNYGMSSFVPSKSLNWNQDFFARSKLEKEFQQFSEQEGLDFLVVGQFNCPDSDKPKGRRYIVYSPEQELNAQIEKAMRKAGEASPGLGLTPEYASKTVRSYQAAFPASRKELKPVFDEQFTSVVASKGRMKM